MGKEEIFICRLAVQVCSSSMWLETRDWDTCHLPTQQQCPGLEYLQLVRKED